MTSRFVLATAGGTDMADYITLLGAEDVRSAASTMKQAAEQMERAAGNIQYSIEMLGRMLEEKLATLEQILDNYKGGT